MDKTKLITEIVELQRRIDRHRRQTTFDAWMNLPPVTMPQLKSLFFISNQGSTSLGKLASALGVTPANVTGIVDRLVENKLITRIENADDRRMLIVRTTGKGEELVANLRERTRSYLSKALSDLNTDELANLSSGLGSLLKAIESRQGEDK
jgi:MarR family transcriptional regulator, organic hydroperoxide resistance regulator